MTTSIESVIAAVESLASASAVRMGQHYNVSVQPRIARLLADTAVVAIRAASGEDVETARIALEASTKNIAREEKATLALEGRDLALRAVLGILLRV